MNEGEIKSELHATKHRTNHHKNKQIKKKLEINSFQLLNQLNHDLRY